MMMIRRKSRDTKAEQTERAHDRLRKIPKDIPKAVDKFIDVNPYKLEWKIDPIQSYTMQMKMQKLPVFAEAMNRNLTGLYFNFLTYKVQMKENIALECKGVTRSGKTTAMISTMKFVGKLTGTPFNSEHVCPNEQYYISLVKKAVDNQGIVVDEQLETHVGIGSFREMQYIEDLNNIIAKRCIHVAWIHPPDFVGRNAFYGLETAGRNLEHKLTKLLLYDLTQKSYGVSSIPLGFVIIPKYRDEEFENEYEQRKDEHIEELRSENIAVRQERRLKEGFLLAGNKLFGKCKNNHQRLQVSRNLFPMRTEGEYMELISIASMNMKLGITEREFEEAKDDIKSKQK